MNEIILNIISVIVTVIVVPLVTLLGTKLIQWINTKVNNTKTAEYLTIATVIVSNAVRSVFQTYVDSLKASGTFDEKAQIVALEKAKNLALSQMTNELKAYLITTFGDFDSWLTIQIEASINTMKNK